MANQLVRPGTPDNLENQNEATNSGKTGDQREGEEVDEKKARKEIKEEQSGKESEGSKEAKNGKGSEGIKAKNNGKKDKGRRMKTNSKDGKIKDRDDEDGLCGINGLKNPGSDGINEDEDIDLFGGNDEDEGENRTKNGQNDVEDEWMDDFEVNEDVMDEALGQKEHEDNKTKKDEERLESGGCGGGFHMRGMQ